MDPRFRTLAIAGISLLMLAHSAQAGQAGNVIFFHPDGTGLSHWDALRVHKVGPDGELNWDRLPEISIYTGHVKDRLVPNSHSGATIHAYGVKVVRNSFGLDGDREIVAASGRRLSIAEEALEAGKSVGLIQSGDIAQPGTAAFVASVTSRRQTAEIARQVIESGAQVIMAGGEQYLLPEGVEGRHGSGARPDGVNLIDRARELGYEIVYTREELLNLDLSRIDRLLGVFASRHTFRDRVRMHQRIGRIFREVVARVRGEDRHGAAPAYIPTAPTIAEMSDAALKILSRNEAGFLLVAEEEGTDNLANMEDAAAQLEALARADAAIDTMFRFVRKREDTLLLVTADSDANGMTVIKGDDFDSEPNETGRPLPFSIGWTGDGDVGGGVVVRAAGLNSQLMQPLMDNTDIYRLMYLTLFGQGPGAFASRPPDADRPGGSDVKAAMPVRGPTEGAHDVGRRGTTGNEVRDPG